MKCINCIHYGIAEGDKTLINPIKICKRANVSINFLSVVKGIEMYSWSNEECPIVDDNHNLTKYGKVYGNCLIKRMMFTPEDEDRKNHECKYKDNSELTDDGKKILMERLL